MHKIVLVSEDSAGNRYFAEFDGNCTAATRTWVERPRKVYIPTGDFSPEQLYIIDFQWEINQSSDIHRLSACNY